MSSESASPKPDPSSPSSPPALHVPLALDLKELEKKCAFPPLIYSLLLPIFLALILRLFLLLVLLLLTCSPSFIPSFIPPLIPYRLNPLKSLSYISNIMFFQILSLFLREKDFEVQALPPASIVSISLPSLPFG